LALTLALALAPTASAAEPEIGDYGDQLLTAAVGPNKAPRAGRIRVLVVPVDFGEGRDFSEILPFFDPDPAAGYTFSNFWRRQSGARLDVDTFVAAPVVFDACPVPAPDCDFDLETVDLAIEAARLIFERVLADLPRPLSDFDLGGPGGGPDGWVDGVVLLIPGYGGGIAPPLWPFLDVAADGAQVGYAAISRLDREIILHEFGHNLGACDQYLWGLKHSLMSWCDDCSLDVHTRVKLGWADVVDVAPGTEVLVDLASAMDAGPVLRVGGARQYYLIEHRTPHRVGDKLVDPALDGVVVLHVDEAVKPPFLAQSNYPEHHALLEVEVAPGDPQRTWLEPGDVLEPRADHAPTTPDAAFRDTNWYDGTRSGIRVAVEAAGVDGAGEGVVRLRVRGEGAEGAPVTRVDRTAGAPVAPRPEPAVTAAPRGGCAGAPGGGPWGPALAMAALCAWALVRWRAR
jgi:hypothetical protein